MIACILSEKKQKKLESYYKWRHNVYIINKYKLLDINNNQL